MSDKLIADMRHEAGELDAREKSPLLSQMLWTAADAITALRAEVERLTREREQLALAICGGEDTPGYANAQTVETLEAQARRAHSEHHADIDRMMRAEAERDRLREALKMCVIERSEWLAEARAALKGEA